MAKTHTRRLFDHPVNYNENRAWNLTNNPLSWNTNASLVFIDNPIGVGYSYGKSGDDYGADDEFVIWIL